MDTFVGDIRLFPYTFTPKGWAECRGQEVPVVEYQELYSLIGTTYGGNGVTSFKLPNLVGTEPMPFMKYYISMNGIYPPRQ